MLFTENLPKIYRKPHVKKNFGSLSRGQKGQNPPHSLDLEKKSNFSKKNFAFFCELNHSEQENEKKLVRVPQHQYIAAAVFKKKKFKKKSPKKVPK